MKESLLNIRILSFGGGLHPVEVKAYFWPCLQGSFLLGAGSTICRARDRTLIGCLQDKSQSCMYQLRGPASELSNLRTVDIFPIKSKPSSHSNLHTYPPMSEFGGSCLYHRELAGEGDLLALLGLKILCCLSFATGCHSFKVRVISDTPPRITSHGVSQG